LTGFKLYHLSQQMKNPRQSRVYDYHQNFFVSSSTLLETVSISERPRHFRRTVGCSNFWPNMIAKPITSFLSFLSLLATKSAALPESLAARCMATKSRPEIFGPTQEIISRGETSQSKCLLTDTGLCSIQLMREIPTSPQS